MASTTWVVTHNDTPVAARYTEFTAAMARNALKVADFARWVKAMGLRGNQSDLHYYVSINHWDVVGPFDMDEEIVVEGGAEL